MYAVWTISVDICVHRRHKENRQLVTWRVMVLFFFFKFDNALLKFGIFDKTIDLMQITLNATERLSKRA